jgi:hypothetical protein
MRPETIGAELAERSYAALDSLGLASAHYPAPGHLPTLPTLIVLFDGVPEIAESNEQILMLSFRGLLFTSLDRIEEQISDVDPLVFPLIDAFSNNLNPSNYHLQRSDGQRVEFCRVERVEASVPVPYNGTTHYGARVFWNVKLRRFAGAT